MCLSIGKPGGERESPMTRASSSLVLAARRSRRRFGLKGRRKNNLRKCISGTCRERTEEVG
jgi:hypothetical protein